METKSEREWREGVCASAADHPKLARTLADSDQEAVKEISRGPETPCGDMVSTAELTRDVPDLFGDQPRATGAYDLFKDEFGDAHEQAPYGYGHPHRPNRVLVA